MASSPTPQPAPGTYAPAVGPPPDYIGPGLDGDKQQLVELPTDVQDLLRSLAKKVMLREQYARLWEIRKATEQRFFYRGDQYGFWNWDQGAYQISQNGGGGFNNAAEGSRQPTFRKAFNIYLGYAKSFMAVFCQASAPTRFEAEDFKDSADIRASEQADKMARIIDKFNDPSEAQLEIGRLLWTDGRVVAETDYVLDGEQFGYEDMPYPDEAAEGVGTQEGGEEGALATGEQDEAALAAVGPPPMRPKGQEVTNYYGVLETKIPLVASKMSAWDYCVISKEFPKSTLKATYPSKADKITSSSLGSGDSEQSARLARIGTAEGTHQLSEDALSYLGTRDTYWFRPRIFYEFEEEDRDKLLGLFPNGCRAVFVGQTYCQSRNASMDDHLNVMWALDDSGGGRISLGTPEVPIQKEFNDFMNMASEAGKYCIPATWCDPEMVDIDAIEEQDSEYGAHYTAKNSPPPGRPLSDSFYTEQPVQFPASVAQYMENLQGPLSQFVTGQQPSLFGGEMSDQQTARGYALARDQAIGLMTLVWLPFKRFRSRIMLQAVRISARERLRRAQETGNTTLTAMVNIPGKPGSQEPIEVALEDLKGNIISYPETDNNFPESWTQQSNKLMQLTQFAGADPMFQALMQQPDNQALYKNLIGLTNFTVPGADSRDKQLEEIADMRNEPPVPDVAAIGQLAAAVQAGQPVTPPTSMPMTCSVPISKYDNDQIEFEECTRWINSPEGQKAKRSPDPKDQAWYMNVELHAGLHQQRMQEVAAQQMQMQLAAKVATQPPPKPLPGKNDKGSQPNPQPTPPEGANLPQASGPPENPSPLM